MRRIRKLNEQKKKGATIMGPIVSEFLNKLSLSKKGRKRCYMIDSNSLSEE